MIGSIFLFWVAISSVLRLGLDFFLVGDVSYDRTYELIWVTFCGDGFCIVSVWGVFCLDWLGVLIVYFFGRYYLTSIGLSGWSYGTKGGKSLSSIICM